MEKLYSEYELMIKCLLRIDFRQNLPDFFFVQWRILILKYLFIVTRPVRSGIILIFIILLPSFEMNY